MNCEEENSEMAQYFSVLKKYVHGLTWLFVVSETVGGIAFGAFLGAQLSGGHYVILLSVFGVIYLALLFIKIWTQKLCPPALVEHLFANVQLRNAKSEIARKETIDGYIDHAIRALNTQTCAMDYAESSLLCEQGVRKSLSEVLEPLISRPQYVLDCNRSKFTIVAVVGYHMGSPDKGYGFQYDSINFRDDLAIASLIPRNSLYNYTDAKGEQLKVQNLVRTAFQDGKLVSETISINGKEISIVCAPIPVVCEQEDSNGAFMIAHEGGCKLPSDLAGVLLIFGRIVANWISKYDACVFARNIASAEKAEKAKLEAAKISKETPLATLPAVLSTAAQESRPPA